MYRQPSRNLSNIFEQVRAAQLLSRRKAFTGGRCPILPLLALLPCEPIFLGYDQPHHPHAARAAAAVRAAATLHGGMAERAQRNREEIARSPRVLASHAEQR